MPSAPGAKPPGASSRTQNRDPVKKCRSRNRRESLLYPAPDVERVLILAMRARVSWQRCFGQTVTLLVITAACALLAWLHLRVAASKRRSSRLMLSSGL